MTTAKILSFIRQFNAQETIWPFEIRVVLQHVIDRTNQCYEKRAGLFPLLMLI